jgi:phosphoribosylglycinamide formyltransferase 1
LKNLVLFASGGGSNALKIIEYFQNHREINITGIVTNNKQSGSIVIATNYNIPFAILSKKELQDPSVTLHVLQEMKADFIILAGFLLLVPAYLIHHYPNKIINIHPALLPKYGGKGMFGMNVHRAVVENGEQESGPTIHLVNEVYDEGEILCQKKIAISKDDRPEDVATKVLELEHQHYAKTIENYIENFRED